MNRLLIVILAICLVIGLWSTAVIPTAHSTAEIGVSPGKIAPIITVANLDGDTVQLAANGKVMILNFWATWCPPCRQEMPELDAFQRQYGDQVDLFVINLQESASTVRQFCERNGYQLPVMLDQTGKAAEIYQVRAIPTTIVIDKTGHVRYRKTGPVTTAELVAWLERL